MGLGEWISQQVHKCHHHAGRAGGRLRSANRSSSSSRTAGPQLYMLNECRGTRAPRPQVHGRGQCIRQAAAGPICVCGKGEMEGGRETQTTRLHEYYDFRH